MSWEDAVVLIYLMVRLRDWAWNTTVAKAIREWEDQRRKFAEVFGRGGYEGPSNTKPPAPNQIPHVVRYAHRPGCRCSRCVRSQIERGVPVPTPSEIRDVIRRLSTGPR